MGNYSCRNLILTALRDTGEVQERVDLQETAAPQSKVSLARPRAETLKVQSVSFLEDKQGFRRY